MSFSNALFGPVYPGWGPSELTLMRIIPSINTSKRIHVVDTYLIMFQRVRVAHDMSEIFESLCRESL